MLVILTQDEDFADLVPASAAGQLLLSRVRQNPPIAERVEIWFRALVDLRDTPRAERLLELADDGSIQPWQIFEH